MQPCTLECDDHKGAPWYGTVAKWLPAGLRQACLVYCCIPGKKSEHFLEPGPRAKGAHASLPVNLLRWGAKYCPHREPPRVNLGRKRFHSVLLQQCREGKLLEMFRKIDAHSEHIALST
jgi:hypothetical protein